MKRQRVHSPEIPQPPNPPDNSSDGETLQSSEIVSIVDEIIAFQGTSEAREAHFKEKYPFFTESFPTLFSMACAPGFDYPRFKYMMSLRDAIHSQRRTLDDASKEVGQVLYDEYVAPIVNNSSEKK
jgi:hypothetical protein